MKKTTSQSAARRAKILTVIALLGVACLSLYVASLVIPVAADWLLDRLERQREAELNYNCAHYGAAMNKHYGRDVCEDEAVHKANL